MKVIEDVSATALPRSTDLDGTVKGAQKYAQLGPDALEKVLDAATTDFIMAGRTAIIFFEMNMLIGDMFDAFLKKRESWNFPNYFVTVTSEEHQHE
eukprot:572543-Lingulodinium_polyedra.AAC.1